MAVGGANGAVAGGVVDCDGRLFGLVWCFFGREAVDADADAGFGSGGGVVGCPRYKDGVRSAVAVVSISRRGRWGLDMRY